MVFLQKCHKDCETGSVRHLTNMDDCRVFKKVAIEGRFYDTL